MRGYLPRLLARAVWLGGYPEPRLHVEIKATATPTARHSRTLDRFRLLAGDAVADHGLLVCRVRERRALPGGHLALPWAELPDWLDERLSA